MLFRSHYHTAEQTETGEEEFQEVKTEALEPGCGRQYCFVLMIEMLQIKVDIGKCQSVRRAQHAVPLRDKPGAVVAVGAQRAVPIEGYMIGMGVGEEAQAGRPCLRVLRPSPESVLPPHIPNSP